MFRRTTEEEGLLFVPTARPAKGLGLLCPTLVTTAAAQSDQPRRRLSSRRLEAREDCGDLTSHLFSAPFGRLSFFQEVKSRLLLDLSIQDERI